MPSFEPERQNQTLNTINFETRKPDNLPQLLATFVVAIPVTLKGSLPTLVSPLRNP